MTNRRAPSPRRWLVVLLAACASLLVHVLLVPLAGRWFLSGPAPEEPPLKVTILDADWADAPATEHRADPVPPTAPRPSTQPAPRPRQLVEIAPTDPTKPEDADYLAEQDSRVDKETRAERFKINPEVVAPRYSDDARLEQKAAEEAAAADAAPETPAQTAPDVGLSGSGPPRTRLPPRFQPQLTPSLASPATAGALAMAGAGAPQNDLLREDVGDSVALNALAYVGAKYLNQVRRQVNFYWSQQIDNLPPSLALTRPRYQTRVNVLLAGDGALEALTVTQASEDGRIDDCIRRAFTMAAPFGAPPAELLGPDGRLRLSGYSFTLDIVRGPHP